MMACAPVVAAGRDAVPLLVAAIRNSDDEKMIPTARWVLSGITGRPLSDTGNKLADLEDFARWWLANCNREREAWIVDALASTDIETARLGLREIHAVTGDSEAPRLIRLLDSPNLYLSRTVLGALWSQLHSSAAMTRAVAVIEAGGPRSDAFVFQTVESKIEPLYPVLLRQLRKASVGSQLPDGLIDAVGKLKLGQEVELLKEWDRDERITASKAVLISTLAALLQADYEPRLFDHLRAGDLAERRQAAVSLGQVGDLQRALPELLFALRANDVEGVAEGAMWGLLSLTERGLGAEELPRTATAVLSALRQNVGLDAARVNRVVSDIAFRYLRARGEVAETPRPGWPPERGAVLDRWGKWWEEHRGRTE